ncbi:MAG: SMP-30/gluconolactonase/LRE family protein [Pseudomonadota bacterium]
MVRVASDGTIDRVIEVPTWKPTCCAFGGADLDTLFITSSRLMSSDDDLAADPHAGGCSLSNRECGASKISRMPDGDLH